MVHLFITTKTFKFSKNNIQASDLDFSYPNDFISKKFFTPIPEVQLYACYGKTKENDIHSMKLKGNFKWIYLFC